VLKVALREADIPSMSEIAGMVAKAGVLGSVRTRVRSGWRVPVLVAGVLAEVIVLTPFSLFAGANFRGSLGALPVAIACAVGLLVGPVAAATVALAGWAFFFPLIVHWSPVGLLALPLWIAPAAAVGVLADRLQRREHQLALVEAEHRYELLRRELADEAQHTLRTPAAVIHGMAEVLLRRDLGLSDQQTRRFLELIADSAQTLMEVPDRFEEREVESDRDLADAGVALTG
jgi:signal transduction histidine kinase